MACIIFIGEAIFALPFHVTRFFRPIMLEVFGLTNFQLGAMFSAYGFVAMAAYGPGGTLADRFSAKKLMATAAFLTAAGGMLMLTIPSKLLMTALYAYWGLTTILLWAAMIRSTREWGGHGSQGRAFGLLDGGRGLVAAAAATLIVALYKMVVPANGASATLAQQTSGLRTVIISYSVLTVLAGVLVLLFVPEDKKEVAADGSTSDYSLESVSLVLKQPSTWLISLIVICAYCGYKGMDNYSVFAVDAFGMSDVEAAELSTWAAWVRPISAIGVGLFADRISSTKATAVSFVILILSYLSFLILEPVPGKLTVLYLTIFFSAVAIYGLRGVYFAIMEEVDVPRHVTGTAVGIISLVGYTPDIFIMPIAGWLIDRSPGATGHQHFYGVLMLFSLIGLIAVLLLRKLGHARRPAESAA